MKTPLFFVVASLIFGQEKPLPYPQVFDTDVLAVRQAFAKGEILPEVTKPRTPDEKKKYAAQFDNFDVLSTQAGFIQAGRGPDDDIETWHLMIAQVSRKMGCNVEKAWELYGKRMRAASGQDGESSLPEAALRAALIGEILSEAKVDAESEQELTKKMTVIRERLGKSLLIESEGGVDGMIIKRTTYGNPADIKNIPPQVKPLPFKIKEPGSEKMGRVLPFMDTERAMQLAEAAHSSAKSAVAWARAKGREIGGLCYKWAKKALQTIVPDEWESWLFQDQGSAYKFTENLRENPKMFDKLKLRKLTREDIPNGLPPVGSIVVYGRGVCGFSETHGHIEIRVPGENPKYCSDHCTSDQRAAHRLACIQRNLGKGDRVNVYVPVRAGA